MKIIAIDNLNRETVADVLVAENVHPDFAKKLIFAWNEKYCPEDTPSSFLIAVSDDYRLWRGIEEVMM